MEERDGIDFLRATTERILYIINRAFYIFCIPSELESPLVRQLLVDKEDDTIQMQMFRKTGFRGRPPIVFLQEQLKLYLEYGLTASKITKLQFPAKPFPEGWLSSACRISLIPLYLTWKLDNIV